MDVSIIIVNWNVKDLLERFLQSIFTYTRDVAAEVVVVDNASTDGSQEMLGRFDSAYENLHVIFNKENAGFSTANNQGMARASGRYVLFMNPDMELMENTPLLVRQYLDAHANVAAMACRLLYADGAGQPNVKRDPTFWSQWWLLYKLHHLWQPPFFKRYLAKGFDYAKEQPVEQVMGACIAVRRSAMERIGGWSEDYFIWWEDVDLCKRIRRAGEVIMYAPVTRVLHYEGKSFAQQMSYAKQKRFNRGMLTYFKKYHAWPAWLFLKLASWDSLFLALVAQIVRIKGKTQSTL